MKIVSLLYSRGSKNICGMYFFNPIFSVKDGDHLLRKAMVRITSKRRIEIFRRASRESTVSFQKIINKKRCIHNIEIPLN